MKANGTAGHIAALFTIIIWGTTSISAEILLAGLFLSESKLFLRKEEKQNGLAK